MTGKETPGFSINVDTDKLSASIAKTHASRDGRTKWLSNPSPVFIDRRAVQVVAFVQDMKTKEILAVRRFTPATGKKGN